MGKAKRKSTKKVIEQPQVEQPEFSFSLKIGSQVLEGKGHTPLEALRAIERPIKIITKGVLTISHGDKKKEMLFNVPRLKRVFYPAAQPYLIKGMILGLK